MDLQEAITQKDSLYKRIKEVRALLDSCTDGSERLRQTDRLRILRDMYRTPAPRWMPSARPRSAGIKPLSARPSTPAPLALIFLKDVARPGRISRAPPGRNWAGRPKRPAARQADFLVQSLRRSMAALTPLQLEIIMARYRDGLSLAEIARGGTASAPLSIVWPSRR